MKAENRIKKLEERTNLSGLDTQILVGYSKADCEEQKRGLIEKHGKEVIDNTKIIYIIRSKQDKCSCKGL